MLDYGIAIGAFMKFAITLLFLPLMVAAGAPAFAQSSAQGESSITFTSPIQVTSTTPLAFGVVGRPLNGSGTVAIDPVTGERTITNGVAMPGDTPGRATFTVTGEPSRTFTTTVPQTFILSNGKKADDITVTLTSSIPTALDLNGSATIGVGGELQMQASTTMGAYTGTFTVSVAYN